MTGVLLYKTLIQDTWNYAQLKLVLLYLIVPEFDNANVWALLLLNLDAKVPRLHLSLLQCPLVLFCGLCQGRSQLANLRS